MGYIFTDFMNLTYEVLRIINYVVLFLLPILYLSQMINLVISIFTKPKRYPKSEKLNTFGYIICARNEEEVIDKLIDSIKKQNYPKELMHIFVVCDNCTDNTESIAKNLGCNVIIRNNLNSVGKGYALDYGIKTILKDYKNLGIDAYFIFDADNLLTSDYTMRMNDLLSAGVMVATSYRNSQNISKNILTANSAFLFLRECEIIHKARSVCNVGTYVSGTGFYVSQEVLEGLGGWPFFTLIEDIEFSLYCANNKIRIGYCHNAIFYDEQTETYRDSFNQKLRWCRGNVECFLVGYKSLIKNLFKKRNISCFEMFTHTLPFPAITMIWSFLYVAILLILAAINDYTFIEFLNSGADKIIMYYLAIIGACYIQVLYTIIRCHKKVKCSKLKLIVYALFFPFYVIWLGLLLTISLFVKVRWKQIKHINDKSINDMEAI